MDVAHENMLLVCPGENTNPDFRHCDSSRAPSTPLTIKPQDIDYRFENIFTYEGGALKTENVDIQYDINTELNLNDDMLVYRRNIVLSQFRKQLPAKNLIDKNALVKKYSTPNKENKKRQYCTLILYFIQVELS